MEKIKVPVFRPTKVGWIDSEIITSREIKAPRTKEEEEGISSILLRGKCGSWKRLTRV